MMGRRAVSAQRREGERYLARRMRASRFGCLASAMPALMALLILVLTALATVTPARAQQDILKQQLAKIDKGAPLLLQADEMIYDRRHDRVIARGNVEVYYAKYNLFSNELIYDQRSNTLSAVGNVRIKQPDGSVINADQIALTKDFRDGFIRSLRIVGTDDSRIAAARAYRQGGETTVFESGVYTPCKPCRDHPEKAPIWRIKARKIIHKKAEGNIYYEDARLEFLGVPVVWLPFFYHPDPTVKRRSGLLAPTFGVSNELGATVEAPYYFALAPDYDLTVTPVVTTKAGILMKGDWRQRLENGAYRVKLAGVYNEDPPANAPTDSEFRGSIQTQGRFSLGSYWVWGWDATLESDDTFRRFYKLDPVTKTERTNQLYLIGQSERNYFDARLYNFRDLQPYSVTMVTPITSDEDANVHPVIDYNYIFADPVLGGELSFDSNAVALSRRDDGTDANRVTAELGWRRTFTGPLGQRVTPFGQARGDLYQVNDYVDPVSGMPLGNGSFGNYLFTAGIDYRYPFVKHTSWATHIVEPVAQVITRNNVENQSEIPNEDAQSLVFDDTLLFDTDKFSGYDRIETGTRANFGLQYTLQTNSGVSARAVFGQSIQVAGENPFEGGSGLENTWSDYVAGFYVDVPSYFRLISQFRFDKDSFTPKRTDVKLAGDYGPLRGSIGYVKADAQPALGILDNREEILAASALQLTTNWAALGDLRYNLELDKVISQGLGLKYSDECFALSVKYEHSTVEVGDVKPEQSVKVRFELKHLGSVDLAADNIGSLWAEDKSR